MEFYRVFIKISKPQLYYRLLWCKVIRLGSLVLFMIGITGRNNRHQTVLHILLHDNRNNHRHNHQA